MEQLLSRSKDTQWTFDPVSNWLADPSQGRALCVLADAGTGKSTISAALCDKVLGRCVGGKWEGPISAFHLLKHSDQRRLDPAGIIKSIAYQLAKRWEFIL